MSEIGTKPQTGAAATRGSRESRPDKELTVEQLRRSCDPRQLGFETTETVGPLDQVVGQDRALRALSFGLGMNSKGFNIYAAGWPGTGRTTAVLAYLRELGAARPVPDDWCYVNNFRDPYSPIVVGLAPGQGRLLRAAMERLIKQLKQHVALAFQTPAFVERRNAISGLFEQQRTTVFGRADDMARTKGFALQATATGMSLVPLAEGRVMREEEFLELPEERRRMISEARSKAEAEVDSILKTVSSAEKQAREQLAELEAETSLRAVRTLVDEVRREFGTVKSLGVYFDDVQDAVLRNMGYFRPPTEDSNVPDSGTDEGGGETPGTALTFWRQFVVNLLVDNTDTRGAPVAQELNMSFDHLFGRIEREAEFGSLVTDFTMLRGGAVHRANGGYLVLPVERLLANPLSWDALKRALRSGNLAIEDSAERVGAVPVRSVRPEPIPVRVKVILIGTPDAYQYLTRMDPDFSELFKVKADFDVEMERNESSSRAYAGFASGLVGKEGLRHLQGAAVARLIEYGSVLAGDQGRLSTHFAQLADVVREANQYALELDSHLITAENIDRALAERLRRSNLDQECLFEEILTGALMIDTDGAAVGQVNGLTVMGAGDEAFGFPVRITAAVGQGRSGVLAIDREADLDGPVHTKGVLILVGYMTQKYAHDKQLNLSANLTFEQTYAEVEGDSASAAELYALLSSLAGAPVQQGLAVTGSVNQWGQVQAVGGVNLKIEGFFDLCRARGLTGKQGVLIPRANVRNLMLKEELVRAVGEGQFHVYPVDNVDQGIEILTGLNAGVRRAGKYVEGTIHAKVDSRLRQLCKEPPPGADQAKKERRRQRVRRS